MKRLRVGLVGAGLVGQAEHAFYLWEERERFAFVALADASADGARGGGRALRHSRSLHANIEGLLTAKLDALVIAAPDSFHPDARRRRRSRPGSMSCARSRWRSPSRAATGSRRRATAPAACVQVAYMKRYDPAYRRALELLPDAHRGREADLRRGQRPRSRALRRPSADDLAQRHSGRAARAGARRDDGAAPRGGRAGSWTRPARGRSAAASCPRWCMTSPSCMACWPISAPSCRRRPITAPSSTRAAASQLAFGLPGGGRVSMTHLNLPGVPDYTERVTVYCADRIVELTFPVALSAPYADAAHRAPRRRGPGAGDQRPAAEL